jgi:mono/diheme cytochrome c family protein
VRNVFIVLIALLTATAAVSACSKSSTNSASNMSSSATSSMATTASNMSGSASNMMAAVKLPIPVDKLPNSAVAAGSASAGAAVFSANCASCHGAGGKNGQVGPQVAGVGLKAGQVAYMVRNPQGVDKTSGMPKLPLTDKQVADVAAYVASLK